MPWVESCQHELRASRRSFQPHWYSGDEAIPFNWFNLVNSVSQSLIRVESDKLTYPLHVILHCQIQKDERLGITRHYQHLAWIRDRCCRATRSWACELGPCLRNWLVAPQDNGRDGTMFVTVNTLPFANVLFRHPTPPHRSHNNSKISRSVKSSLCSWHKASPQKADTPQLVLMGNSWPLPSISRC